MSSESLWNLGQIVGFMSIELILYKKMLWNDKIETGEVTEDSYFSTEWISCHNLLDEKSFLYRNCHFWSLPESKSSIKAY